MKTKNNKKEENFNDWILSRWHFWIIVIFYTFWSNDFTFFATGEFIGILAISFLFIYVVYIIVYFIRKHFIKIKRLEKEVKKLSKE